MQLELPRPGENISIEMLGAWQASTNTIIIMIINCNSRLLS